MAQADPAPPPEVVYRTCPLCEATCGIAVEVDRAAGRVVTIRGDDEDPFSRGYLCPKAYGLKALQEDPDRLRRPIRRTADGLGGDRLGGGARVRGRGPARGARRARRRGARRPTSATRTPTISAPRSTFRRCCARSAASDASRRRASTSFRRCSPAPRSSAARSRSRFRTSTARSICWCWAPTRSPRTAA